MKKPAIIAIIVALVVAGLGYFLIFANNDEENESVEPETTQNLPAEDTDTEDTSQPDDATEAATSAVTIVDGSFGPGTVTVARGTTVTWTNQGSQQHDVTPDTETAGFQQSELLSNGDSYSVTFNTPGTYTYHCSPHPEMTGTVVVTE